MDNALRLMDRTLPLADGTLTLVGSTLTLKDSTLTLVDNALSLGLEIPGLTLGGSRCSSPLQIKFAFCSPA